jgi:trehalose-6-phosphate synthase
MPNGVEFEGRLAHVGTFPIGIEPSSFTEVSRTRSYYRSANYPFGIEFEKEVSRRPDRAAGTAFQWC